MERLKEEKRLKIKALLRERDENMAQNIELVETDMKWKIIPNPRETRKTLETFIHVLPMLYYTILYYTREAGTTS